MREDGLTDTYKWPLSDFCDDIDYFLWFHNFLTFRVVILIFFLILMPCCIRDIVIPAFWNNSYLHLQVRRTPIPYGFRTQPITI